MWALSFFPVSPGGGGVALKQPTYGYEIELRGEWSKKGKKKALFCYSRDEQPSSAAPAPQVHIIWKGKRESEDLGSEESQSRKGLFSPTDRSKTFHLTPLS